MNKLLAMWELVLSRGFLLFTDNGFTTSAIPSDKVSISAMIDSAEQYIVFLEQLKETPNED